MGSVTRTVINENPPEPQLGCPTSSPDDGKVYLLDQDGKPILIGGELIEVYGCESSPHIEKIHLRKGEQR